MIDSEDKAIDLCYGFYGRRLISEVKVYSHRNLLRLGNGKTASEIF